jgi:hypothetical protein
VGTDSGMYIGANILELATVKELDITWGGRKLSSGFCWCRRLFSPNLDMCMPGTEMGSELPDTIGDLWYSSSSR